MINQDVPISSDANLAVLEFYKEMPFNLSADIQTMVRLIKEHDPVEDYPFLSKLLFPGARVLDVGCGTGWLSMAMAANYNAIVTGVDFNPVALEIGRKIANQMETKAEFVLADLFSYNPQNQFDIVISMGVLHHTNSCLSGIKLICNKFVKPGGHIVIGLYHKYARRPFLEYFFNLRKNGMDESFLLEEFKRLRGVNVDQVHLLSWFRDQVLHPHETQHTLAEILPLLEANGCKLTECSLNNFSPFSTPRELFVKEPALETEARRKLQRGEYVPGFFVMVGCKNK